MKTSKHQSVDHEAHALIEHIMSGKPIEPELLSRIRERGEEIRRETFEKHGLLDVAVPSIRELRGDLPE